MLGNCQINVAHTPCQLCRNIFSITFTLPYSNKERLITSHNAPNSVAAVTISWHQQNIQSQGQLSTLSVFYGIDLVRIQGEQLALINIDICRRACILAATIFISIAHLIVSSSHFGHS